ncbi:MAG: hypothetical protein K2K05_04410 [Muribaculaceae bacterium]|nr:hypothetical protein [Muribaculaceae bacterium]
MSRQAILHTIYVIVAILAAAFIFNAGEWGYITFVVFFSIIAMRLVVAVAKLLRKRRKNPDSPAREYALKLTALMMGILFITGTLLFTVTFRTIGTDPELGMVFNNVELVLRSMMCSVDLFMLNVDSNILDALKGHTWIKAALTVQAVAAFMCTIGLLASLVMARVKAYYLLHRRTKITPEKDHLCIFFGIDDHSRLLASDIAAKNTKAICIFVDYADVDDDDNDSWSNLVGLFTHRQSTFDVAKDSNALVTVASKPLCDIDSPRLNDEDPDVFALTGIEKIRDLIVQVRDFGGELSIFFMSEDEDHNIRSLMNLAKDATIRSCASLMKIYCHARFNGPNRVVEDLAVRKKLRVEIIDSSHLSVEILKLRADDHPVRVVHLDSDNPTMVASPLRSLIVGFGEVGRDAFRFLYEFGSFIRMGSHGPEVARPEISAVDASMDHIKGAFVSSMPAIDFTSGGLCLDEVDCRSLRFYDHYLSEQNCRELNYIVLALGDDDLNISLATNIFTRIRRWRDDMSHLIIMVRCVSDEKRELMDKVAAHYNLGSDDGRHRVIRIFGNPREIYTYDLIVRAGLRDKAMTYFRTYYFLRKDPITWQNRFDKLMRISDSTGYPDIDNLRKLRRQESQDHSDALHAATKMWLLKNHFADDYDWDGFAVRYFDGEGYPDRKGGCSDISYPKLNAEENEVILNLAMLEHARWNAAHELMGYVENTDGHSCDERGRRHNCLKSWQELDAESLAASTPEWECDYKVYDFGVVETTIAIALGRACPEPSPTSES